MVEIELRRLIGRLDASCRAALEAAASTSASRGHYEVTVEHLLLHLCDDPQGEAHMVLRHFDCDPARLTAILRHTLEGQMTGNPGRPVFSGTLTQLFRDAFMLGALEFGANDVCPAIVLATIVADPAKFQRRELRRELDALGSTRLRPIIAELVAARRPADAAPVVASDPGMRGEGPLARYCTDFTAIARDGRIDPVFCRDLEIQQMIDILGRRRKNNPLCVGDAGVGKTAVVEGLALRIARDEVPDFLRSVDLLGLDLGLLQAGASVKGEFENRLQSVMDAVRAAARPTVLFIDEAHMLIGAGGQAGGSDAANLLKPALARGELRSIAATTWAEYKKYFEKDAALARRFQLVRLDEPSPDQAVTILRGLRDIYERAHGVYIRDSAVEAAARLSARYIAGRQLPDKAVDVLDTASARVRLSQTSLPGSLERRRQAIAELDRTLAALRRDEAMGGAPDARITQLEADHAAAREALAELEARYAREQAGVAHILDLRARLAAIASTAGRIAPAPGRGIAPAPAGEDIAPARGGEDMAPARADVDVAPAQAGEDVAPAQAGEDVAPAQAGDGAVPGQGGDMPGQGGVTAGVADADRAAIQAELDSAIQALRDGQRGDGLVAFEVDAGSIAEVIADWTGIPLGAMLEDERTAVLGLEHALRARVIGQDHAVSAVSERIRIARADLRDPEQPVGVFLFAGPSGTGKTELATAMADTLFGGERFMVRVNMSEFQERHTVSKLIGSPPGYVGYGEGGILTEAVRQRPYSVVLLDEVEKADPEVLNLFYQVFDKGVLADGEGRLVDFRNTILVLTSNLGSERIAALCEAGAPASGEVADAVRPVLNAFFKPALLARMEVVPFLPLSPAALGRIVTLKLNRVSQRLLDHYGVPLSLGEGVTEALVQRCARAETGARNIDHIVNGTLLPTLATELLSRMGDADAAPLRTIRLLADEGGALSFAVG